MVTLGGHDHVVPAAKLEPGRSPGVKVILNRNVTADALDLTDGPVLVKGGGALDRGLVDAAGAVDVVGAAVRLEGPELGGPRAGVVGAVGLDDVVLDEGVGGPTVEGKVWRGGSRF